MSEHHHTNQKIEEKQQSFTLDPNLQQSIHSQSSQRSTIQILKNKIISLQQELEQKNNELAELNLKIVESQLEQNNINQDDSFQQKNKMFELATELNTLKIRNLQQKQNLKREFQLKLETEIKHYEQMIQEQQQDYQKKLNELKIIHETLLESIQGLKKQNNSLSSLEQPQELIALKKTNQKLVQQNNQQLSKLYKALAQIQQLHQQLQEFQSKCSKLIKKSAQQQSLHARQLKQHEQLIQSYKIIKQQGKIRSRSKSSGISSSQDEIVLTSSIKLQVTSIQKEVQRLKKSEQQKNQQLKNIKQLIQQRQDDNRYLRNQLLIKDQEIFKLKALTNQKQKVEKPNNFATSDLIIAFDDEKQDPNQIFDSQIIPLSELSGTAMSRVLQQQNSKLRQSLNGITSDRQSLLNRIQQMAKQNIKLKDELYQLQNNVGDSRRQEQLSLIRGQRDRLFSSLNKLKNKQQQYLLKIKELENAKEEVKPQFEQVLLKQQQNKTLRFELQNMIQKNKRNQLVFTDNIAQLEIQNNMLKKNIKLLVQEVQKLKQNGISREHNTSTQISQQKQFVNGNIQDILNDKNNLKQDNQVLKRRLQECQSRLLLKTKQISELKHEVIQLQTKQKLSNSIDYNRPSLPISRSPSGRQLSNDRQLHRLKHQKQLLDKQIQELSEQLMDKQQDIQRFKKQIQSLKKQLNSKVNLLKSNEQIVQQLRQKQEINVEQLSKLNRQKIRSIEQIRKMALLLNQHKKVIEQTQQNARIQQNQYHEKLNKLESQLSNSLKNKKNTEGKIKTLNQQKIQISSQLFQISQQLTLTQQKQLTLRKKVQEIQNQKNIQIKTLKQFEQKNKQLIKNNDKLTKSNLEIEALTTKLHKLEKERDQLQETLKKQIISNHEEKMKPKQVNQSSIKDFQKQQSDLRQKQNTILDQTNEINSLSSKLTISTQQNDVLKKQLLDLKTLFNKRLQYMALQIQDLRTGRNKDKILDDNGISDIQYDMKKQLQVFKEKYLQIQLDNKELKIKYQKEKKRRKADDKDSNMTGYHLQKQVQLLNQLLIQKDKQLLQMREYFKKPFQIVSKDTSFNRNFKQSNTSFIPKNPQIRHYKTQNEWKKVYHIFPSNQTSS